MNLRLNQYPDYYEYRAWRRRHKRHPKPSVARMTPAPKTPEERAERIGYRNGLANRVYMPELNFQTSEEWAAHLRGYRRAQAELKAMETNGPCNA